MDRIKIGFSLLEKLESRGYAAYLVGGTVRDYLLGLAISDIDIASSAKPDEVLAIWPDAIPTGIKYGTVTVLAEGQAIEVTTFREESSYRDFRRPDKVDFGSSLEVDLARRDFTINALAMDGRAEIIDYERGREDLQAQLIRAVGDPADRFREDPLRMLRALRFVAQLGFAIEAGTWQELVAHASYIEHVALERVKNELDRLLIGPYVDQAIKPLADSRLLQSIPYIAETKLQQATSGLAVSLLLASTRPTSRWYVLLRSLAAEEFTYLLINLPFSKKERADLTALRELDQILTVDLSEDSLKACLLKYREDLLAEVLQLQAVAGLPSSAQESRSAAASHWLARLAVISESLPVRSVRDLAINGNDLVRELAMKPGRQIGEIMEELLYQVAFKGLANNEKNLLLEAARIRGEILERLSNS